MTRRPPKRPYQGKPPKRGKPATKRRARRPASSTKKRSKPRVRRPTKRRAPAPTPKPRKRKPTKRRARVPVPPRPPTFVEEIQAIIDRSHSVKRIEPSVNEFAGRKWDAFEAVFREEIPIDEIPHIARAVERKFRTRFRSTVRTTYLGIERNEAGKKVSDGYITLKSATKGGFEMENELQTLKPDASGRYGTFRRLVFELKRPAHIGKPRRKRQGRTR